MKMLLMKMLLMTVAVCCLSWCGLLLSVCVCAMQEGSYGEVGDLVGNSPYSEVSRGSEEEEDDIGMPCF